MSTLFVVRNGETELETAGKISGIHDGGLDGFGKMHAHRCASQLLSAHIDTIISSPLPADREMAEIIAGRYKIDYSVDEALTEQDYGIYEGRPADDPEFQAAREKVFYRFPDGESVLDAAARVYPFLNALKARQDDRRIMLIAHFGICRLIVGYQVSMTNEQFLTFRMKAGEVVQLKL